MKITVIKSTEEIRVKFDKSDKIIAIKQGFIGTSKAMIKVMDNLYVVSRNKKVKAIDIYNEIMEKVDAGSLSDLERYKKAKLLKPKIVVNDEQHYIIDISDVVSLIPDSLAIISKDVFVDDIGVAAIAKDNEIIFIYAPFKKEILKDYDIIIRDKEEK